jgi:hypothetical protein
VNVAAWPCASPVAARIGDRCRTGRAERDERKRRRGKGEAGIGVGAALAVALGAGVVFGRLVLTA